MQVIMSLSRVNVNQGTQGLRSVCLVYDKCENVDKTK